MNSPTMAWKPDWETGAAGLPGVVGPPGPGAFHHRGPQATLEALPSCRQGAPIPTSGGAIRWLGGPQHPEPGGNLLGRGGVPQSRHQYRRARQSGLFLGSIGHPAPHTMWYEPSITISDRQTGLRSIRPAPTERHVTMLEAGLKQCRGRYAVGYPDLVENIDTLAQVRDPQLLLWTCSSGRLGEGAPAGSTRLFRLLRPAVADAADPWAAHVQRIPLWGPAGWQGANAISPA